MVKRALIVCFALLLSLSAAGQPEQPPSELPDQHGMRGGLDDFAGSPVLVIVVSARKLRHVQRWEEGLRRDVPTLVSMRVADVAENPKPEFDAVADKLRKRAPEDVSVYIDMANVWASTYGLDTDEPCLLLFDANREVVARFRGRANAERLSQVTASLAGYFSDPSPSGSDMS